MSKFAVLSSQNVKTSGTADHGFAVYGSEPNLSHDSLERHYRDHHDMEYVKQRAGWDANSVGYTNIVFLRKCNTDHLKAIIANVLHIKGTFTVDIIKSILAERCE